MCSYIPRCGMSVCFLRSPAFHFISLLRFKMSGIQTTENAACQQGGDLELEGKRREERREVGMKVSLGERERVRKNLNPQRGRERERAPLLLALTLFAKVQSSGTTDRKVKINHRSAPNFLLLFRRRRRRKRFEFRFAAAAAGADPKFPTRFEVGRIDRRASETPILKHFPPEIDLRWRRIFF